MKNSMKYVLTGCAAVMLLYAGWGKEGFISARQLSEADFDAVPALQARATAAPGTALTASGSGFSVDKGTRSFKLGADTRTVVITGENGSIELKQGRGKDIEVHTKVFVTGASRLEAQSIADKSGIKVSQGAVLEIKTYSGTDGISSRNPPSIHVTVTLPQGVKADLQAELSNGNITLSNVTSAGSIELTSQNGQITAKGSGSELSIQTDNGRVDVSDAKKCVKISVINGNIRAERISGALDMEVTSGNLSAEDAFSSIEAISVAGNIHIASSKVGGNWNVSNTAGNVSLAWPKQADVEVDASSSFGKPETDLPLTVKGGRISGTLGAGTYHIKASSLAGLSLMNNN